ncbi:MAG: 4-hydroxy-tetrahydrodipicolinate synthase [Clostridia bacterium]|nr:4-hydroxy-tetrahydrodipicolinate synthase [Clostridia bacterium]
MKPVVFKGSGVALVTPFDKSGENINFDKLGELIEYHIDNSTDAIILCGTTGEAPTLPDDQHKAAIEFAVAKVKGRIPLIAGTGSNDTAHAVMMTKFAQKAGADAVLCVTPYYNKTTQRGLIKNYEAIAACTDLPIIMYSVPSRTGVNITPETAKVLSEIDNIVAIKEASGNISQVAKIAAMCGDKLAIYSGNDDQIVPVMALGGIGVISVLANVAPKQTHDMVMSYLVGRTHESLKMQLDALELTDALFCEVNPIPVKEACNMLGFDVGPVRLPLYEMSDENKIRLKAALSGYGLLK